MTDLDSPENKSKMKSHLQNRRIPTILPAEVNAELFELAIKLLDVSSIEQVVCNELKVDTCFLLKRSRKREFVYPRQLMMYYLSCSFDYSYMFIGRRYGFDHATCMYAKRLIETLMSVDKQIYRQVSFIAHKIIFKAA